MSVDPAEIRKFDAIAEEWWDPDGKFAALHLLNPCRLDYINSQIELEFDRDLQNRNPFSGLRILDLGCGGGLLTEPMARLGAEVTGVDASANNIDVAEAHHRGSGLAIRYISANAEELPGQLPEQDVVLAMEIIEHVTDQAAFVKLCGDFLAPGGMLISSTISRTAKSFALAIVGAEYLLRWLPRGTHDWSRFVRPAEMDRFADSAGLEMVDRKGFVFDPLRWVWRTSTRDFDVNYVSVHTKPHSRKQCAT